MGQTTPNPFSPSERRSNQVFLVTEKNPRLKEFIKNNTQNIQFIDDHIFIESMISQIRLRSLSSILRKPIDVLSYLFSGVNIDLKFISVDFANIQKSNRQIYRGFSDTDIIYIRENEIRADQFARFLDPLANVPLPFQPIIIIEPASGTAALKDKLALCSSRVMFTPFEDTGGEGFRSKGVCERTQDFVNLYSDSCHDSISRSSYDVVQSLFLGCNEVQKLAAQLLFLRSKIVSQGRQHAIADLRRLIDEFNARDMDLMDSEFADSALFLKSMIILNELYCTENPAGSLDTPLLSQQRSTIPF